MNLTAVTEKSEVMERHIEDSLAILSPMNESYSSNCGSSCDSINVVDVGSGAGLPGLILAIACPGIEFPHDFTSFSHEFRGKLRVCRLNLFRD